MIVIICGYKHVHERKLCKYSVHLVTLVRILVTMRTVIDNKRVHTIYIAILTHIFILTYTKPIDANTNQYSNN